jgi:hypothetical protein
MMRIGEEVAFTKGRIIVRGKLHWRDYSTLRITPDNHLANRRDPSAALPRSPAS